MVLANPLVVLRRPVLPLDVVEVALLLVVPRPVDGPFHGPIVVWLSDSLRVHRAERELKAEGNVDAFDATE